MRSLFAVGYLRNEKGAEAKMCPVNVFGIDTGLGKGGGVLGLVFLTSIADSPAGLEKSERTCHLQKRLQVTSPGGDICFNFCWECVAGLSEPLAHYSLFCGLIIDPILVTFGRICNF